MLAETADQPVVEPFGRVGDHGDGPQHQVGIERRVGRALGIVGPRVLGQSPDDALVHAVDRGQDAVGLGACAEEDGLEHAARVGDPPEGCALVAGVHARADVVERLDGADAERALAVHEPNGLLFVDRSQYRCSAREIAVVH